MQFPMRKTDRGIKYSSKLEQGLFNVETPEVDPAIIVSDQGYSKKGTGLWGKWVVCKRPLHDVNDVKQNFPLTLRVVDLPEEIQFALLNYAIAFEYTRPDQKSIPFYVEGYYPDHYTKQWKPYAEQNRIFCLSCLGFAKDLESKNDMGFYVYSIRLPNDKDLIYWEKRNEDTKLMAQWAKIMMANAA